MIDKIQKFAFLTYMFSINFEMYDPTGMGMLSLAKIFGFIYLLSVLPNVTFFINQKGLRSFTTPIFLLYVLITIISIFNLNSYSSYFLQTGFLLNLVFFLFLVNHERKKQGIFNKGLVAFALGASLISVLYYFGFGIEISDDGRLSLFGDNENNLAIRLSVACIILVYFGLFALKEKKYSKGLIFLLQLPLILPIMISTGSRVALFSLFLSLGCGLVLLRYKRNTYRFFAFALSIIAFQFVYDYVLESEVMSRRLDKTFEQENLGGRQDIWNSIIPLINDNAVLGVGISGYQKHSILTFGKISSPHNVLLELLAYSGIIGLCLFLFFIFKLMSISIKNYLMNKLTLSLILFSPVFGLFLSGQALDVKIVWIILAYSASRIFCVKKSTTNLENPLLYR